MNIHSFSPETLWWTQTILQGKPLQEIYFQAALARKPNEPTRLHHMQPPALKHTASSQHWVIRRTYAGIKPSESKHTLLECVDIYYGKTPFSCLLVLFSTFLLPSIVAWRQEGVVEEVEFFSASWKKASCCFIHEDAHICSVVQEKKRWMKIKVEINPASNSATVTGENCLKHLTEATKGKTWRKWDHWEFQQFLDL